MQKEYVAIVEGVLSEQQGTINFPIRRKEGSIMEREISEEGQKAITHFEVIQTFTISKKDYSLIYIF